MALRKKAHEWINMLGNSNSQNWALETITDNIAIIVSLYKNGTGPTPKDNIWADLTQATSALPQPDVLQSDALFYSQRL